MNFMHPFQANIYRGFRSSETYNKFLEENPPLESVLDHSSTIDEILCGNSTLDEEEVLHSFTKELIEELIQLITEEPNEDDSNSRIFKYPFVAAEFFNEDFPKLLGFICENEELLSQFFQFLYKDSLNLTLAGYFSKAFETLVNINSEAIFKFIFDNQIEKKFVEHIWAESVAECVEKVVSGGQIGNKYREERLKVIDLVVKSLGADEMSSFNSQEILSKLLLGKESFKASTEIRDYLNKEEIISSLFEYLKAEEHVVKNTANLLKNLLITEKTEYFEENTDNTSTLVKSFTENLYLVAKILQENPVSIPFEIGKEIVPLGLTRYTLIAILEILITKPSLDLHISLKEQKIFILLLNLFKTYQWNSLFHSAFNRIIEVVVSGDFEILKKHLFEEANLLPELVQLGLTPNTNSATVDFRKGNMGHIFHLISYLSLQSDPYIQSQISICPNWPELEYIVEQQSEIEKKPLGGKPHFNFFEGISSEEENFKLDFDYNRVFARNSIGPDDENTDFLDLPESQPITCKDLEDLSDLFDLHEEKSERKNIYSSTFCVNNATFEEYESMEFMSNHFWKLSTNSKELEPLE